MIKKNSSLFFIVIILGVLVPKLLLAGGTTTLGCAGNSFSPWNDICWHCIYPIKMAQITVEPDPNHLGQRDVHSQVLCSCTYDFFPWYREGVTFSYWEPVRYVETTKVPYCFPGVGSQLDRGINGSLEGGSSPKAGRSMAATTFAQAHNWIFDTWSILGLMMDSSCVESNADNFDLSYLTETDSGWNDDEMDMQIEPESILFANPVAQMSCAIDAVAATATFPLDMMFWCEGSWGSAYPMTGSFYNADYTVANAAIAARLLEKEVRQAMIWDGSLDLCTYIPTLLWFKSHFKMQQVRPVTDTYQAIPIGKPGFLWSYSKNPPGKTINLNSNDNFMWMIFSKVECCN